MTGQIVPDPSSPFRLNMTRPLLYIALLFTLPAAVCKSTMAPAGEILTFEVAPTRTTCMAEGERQCLLVRENADAEWRRFYDSISGFAYEEGYRYRIRVERQRVARPPADGSSYTYRLVELLSKERSP
jgi:hypothetical protein